MTSTGTFTGGSTGTNYDKLADALQGSNPGAGVCNGGTVFVYIDTNDNPALDKNITIQGVGNVSWTYSSGALIQPAESTGITIANMAVSQGGSFALLTTSGNASGSLVFIQDTITEGSGVPALINFGSGNNPPLQPIGKIYFMQSVLMGNGSNSVGLDIGNNTTNEGGFLFENSIMCGFSEAVSTTVALPTGYLTFLNSDLANNSSDALYSSVASNNIAVTNTAFIGNGVDNSGFSQAGFDFDAFGTDSTGGYANSIVISSSDFLNSGGSCAAASSNNLQESATSKLFSAGTNLYAAGVQNDILGNPRPVSGSFDIGAYQTVVANTATPTATSTNTPTNTPTTTATTTPTNTSTSTPTITSTNTSAATNTPTVTFTATMTSTFTFTPTSTVTATPTCITHIWPDPYNPKEAFNGKLFISCMSPGTFVMIYTVSGELVKTLNSTNGGICSLTGISGTTYCWDGRNELKTQVASGIYFYVIQQGDQITQKGKFLLVNEN